MCLVKVVLFIFSLLVGAGAKKWAEQAGIKIVPSESMICGEWCEKNRYCFTTWIVDLEK